MAVKFPRGTVVRQIVQAPVEGTVEGFSVDIETGELQVLVQWTDASGEVHYRHFGETQIEAVPVIETVPA
jgi:hypothetical protein